MIVKKFLKFCYSSIVHKNNIFNYKKIKMISIQINVYNNENTMDNKYIMINSTILIAYPLSINLAKCFNCLNFLIISNFWKTRHHL